MENYIYVLILIYSLSIIFYMADLIEVNLKYRLWARRSLFSGGFLHLILFTFNVVTGNVFQLVTLYGVLFFYSLILIVTTIILHHFLDWKILELISIFLGLITLFGAVSIGKTFPIINEELHSRILYIHILFTIISYSAFSISAIFSILYLFQEFLLKQKIWNRFTQALPSLESVERYIYYTNLFGVPMLFLGLILGFGIDIFLDWTILLDPKVITSFIIFFMYSNYIINRHNKKLRTKQLAKWNLIAFMFVVINLTIINNLGSFHKWF